jgi:hypothetical protein
MICEEQVPAVVLIGAVMNASLLAVKVTVGVDEVMVTLSVVSLAV